MELTNIQFENIKETMEMIIDRIEKLEAPAIIHFSKTNENAIIPTRLSEDAGFDLYACFDADMIIIYPHTTYLIPTGIATAFDKRYVFKLAERGSTGTKQMAQRSGVIDSGFRGEIKAPITNLNNVPIIITKMVNSEGKPLPKEELKNSMTILTKKGNITNINANTYEEMLENAIVYPYTKAITQGVLYYIPETVTDEIPYEILKGIDSKRGDKMLGASGK